MAPRGHYPEFGSPAILPSPELYAANRPSSLTRITDFSSRSVNLTVIAFFCVSRTDLDKKIGGFSSVGRCVGDDSVPSTRIPR
ncbi:hypothetical protein V498_10091 [Pseudogymnoascus sp. VKM F-4517 (FW-2822)]|nr:hypothetical protein V498_10091 [Pseudogymnoascus sp. VKM F-4517 (FW-2822)]